MEELDDGEGETLVVSHGVGGLDLSAATVGKNLWAAGQVSQPLGTKG